MSAPSVVRPTVPALAVPALSRIGGYPRPALAIRIERRTPVRPASPADFSCADYLKYLEADE